MCIRDRLHTPISMLAYSNLPAYSRTTLSLRRYFVDFLYSIGTVSERPHLLNTSKVFVERPGIEPLISRTVVRCANYSAAVPAPNSSDIFHICLILKFEEERVLSLEHFVILCETNRCCCLVTFGSENRGRPPGVMDRAADSGHKGPGFESTLRQKYAIALIKMCTDPNPVCNLFIGCTYIRKA